MPNIKSAIKRVSVIEKKTARNNMIKSGYKSAVKKFEQEVKNKNVEEATKLFSEATKKIDQACTKGVIVKNTAARKKSNLAKKLNAMNAKKKKKLCTVFYFKRSSFFKELLYCIVISILATYLSYFIFYIFYCY